jgi:phenylalanyl-tRNA synthetase beta chain
VGIFGELHPLVQEKYDFDDSPVLAAELDLDLLRGFPPAYAVAPVPEFPPVLEDIAVIVDESIPAAQVESLIRESGGDSLSAVRLFDVFRGAQVGAGKKSLAYSLTYQAFDRTLTDSDAAQIRNRIVKRLEQEAGARLRS